MFFSWKTILIGLGSLLCFIWGFYTIYEHQGIRSQTFQEYQYSIITIIFLRWFLTLIRDTTEQTTKWLKKLLIMIVMYLLTVIFIKPSFNFSQAEFLIFYISVVWTIYSANSIYPQTKKIWIGIWGGVIGIMLIHNFLFIFRNTPDFLYFYDTIPYTVYNLSSVEDLHYPDTLSIISPNTTKTIPLKTNHTIALDKNQTYVLNYHSQSGYTDNIIVIQTPSWHILEIFPMSSIKLTTESQTPTWEVKYWQIREIKLDSRPSNEFIETLQNKYLKWQKNFIMSYLPPAFQSSENLQFLASRYSTWISNNIPFYHTYKKNIEIYKNYIVANYKNPFPKSWIERSSIKKHQKIWREKTDTLHKLRTNLSTRF